MLLAMPKEKDLKLSMMALRNFEILKEYKDFSLIKNTFGLGDFDFIWFIGELKSIRIRKRMNKWKLEICELCGLKRHYRGIKENVMKCDKFGNVLCETCFAEKPHGVYK